MPADAGLHALHMRTNQRHAHRQERVDTKNAWNRPVRVEENQIFPMQPSWCSVLGAATLQPGGGRFHVPSPRGGLAHTVRRGLFFSLLVPFNGYIFLKARTPTDSAEMSQRSKKETDSHASACERGTLARKPDSPRAPSPAPPLVPRH